MSLKASSRVWEECPVAGTDLLLMLAIADFADDSGTNAFPSKQTLARKTRLDCSTVRRRIRALERSGHLTASRCAAPGGRTNMYTIHFSGAMQDALNPDEQAGNTAGPSPEPVGNCVDRSQTEGANRPGADRPQGVGAAQGEAQLCLPGGSAAAPPEPSLTVSEPSPAAAEPAPELPAVVPGIAQGQAASLGAVDEQSQKGSGQDADEATVADTVLGRLGHAWPLTAMQRRHLAPRVTRAIVAGWTVKGLASYLAAHPEGVRAPYAVLSARLDQLPPSPAAARHARPPWCGYCDEDTRHIELADGRPARCPDCHPLREPP